MATTEHSPNRQPRWRNPAQMARRVARKKVFLDLIRAGALVKEAAGKIKTDAQLIRTWLREDAEFLAGFQEAMRMGEGVAEGELRGLLPKAVEAVEAGLDTRDLKIRVDTGIKVLRGRGLLVERQSTELQGKGGGPVEFTLNIGKKREEADAGNP